MRKSEPIDRGEISQFISQIEDRHPKALKSLAKYFQADSLRRSVCFTGPAGVGKSTLIAKLLPLAAKSMRVAWLACDPSSPVSGGSLLGDRIRSSGQDLSQSIFIRSMSTRGMSAFSQSIRDVEVYLEHFFDRIWVETAGSGQTQSEVARISALTVLVLQPETGDEVQWMKSGVREWCDLFVIHKSDLPGGDLMKQSLIEMGANPEAVVQVSSKTGEGLSELVTRLEKALSAVKWKDRAAVLHGSLAEAIFMEREAVKLRKQFSKKRAKLLKQPY